MKRVLEVGDKTSLIPSVITFDSHPGSFINGNTIPLINSPEDRADLLRRVFGIEDIIFLHFDKTTVSMAWDRFIDHLIEEFGARYLVAGNDFRFGFNAEGSSRLLAEMCAKANIGCDIIPDVLYDGIVSNSTYIRELLIAGDMERANAFLGHPHVLTDVVRYGYKLGRTLGTPTINMRFAPGVLVPAFGVYATKIYLEDWKFTTVDSGHTQNTNVPIVNANVSIVNANVPIVNANVPIGVTNIGIRPTVDDSGQTTAETHILDFQQNLYGHKVRIEFYKRLRPEIKFSTVAELKEQIQKDCKAASEYFSCQSGNTMLK